MKVEIIDGEEWVCRKEAAAFLDYTYGTLSVKDCTKSHDLKKYKKKNGRVYYKPADLIAYKERELIPR